MRQAHPNPYGYAPAGQQSGHQAPGQQFGQHTAYQHGYGAPYQDTDIGPASFQRIDGLRNALASIEQRIGGMSPPHAGQHDPQFQPTAPMRSGVAPHPGPYAQPYASAEQPVETMQQQLNRLATQVGQANTAMRRPPAAPNRQQAQPQHVPQQQMPQQQMQPQQPTVDLSAITKQMKNLRQELSSLKEEVAKPVSVKTSVAQEEVDRIASAIAAMQSKDRIDPQAFDRLTADLNGLRSAMKSDVEETVRRTVAEQADHEAENARAVSQKLDHIAHGLAAAQKAALETAGDDGHVAGRIDDLARQMEQLALHTASYGENHGEDIARQDDLARRIDALSNQVASGTNTRAEHLERRLDELSSQIATGASQGTDDLERRLEALSQQIASSSNGYTDDLSRRFDDLASQFTTGESNRTDELAGRIDALRSSVGELPQTLLTQAIGRLEETLDAVSRKIEQLSEATTASTSAQASFLDQSSQRETLSQDDLSQIESRLDEIARAVVAVSNISREAPHVEMPAIDLSGMDRIEARMSELARTVDEIATVANSEPQRDPALDDIAVRIEGLTDRLGSFEKYARSGDLGNASAMFSAPDTGQIEEQLRNLTARVEEAAAANSTGAQMASLEAQVAQMMQMLDREPQFVPGEVDFAPLEQRLAGIESHLQQAPDLTVNAAQEAARQAIAMVGENSEQGQIVAALSDHLNQLQRMAETGNAGTGQLQETLQAVMGRLDAIENSVERGNDSRNSVPFGAATHMPSASQLHDAPVGNPYAHEHQMAAQAEQTFAAADTLLDVAESDQRHNGQPAFVSAPSVDPTDHLDGLPPLDAGDGAEDHAPLEPNGSRDPLAAFAPAPSAKPAGDSARPNAVAAARRALQATSAEMTATRDTPVQPAKGKKAKGAQSANTLDGLKDKLAALASKSNSETLDPKAADSTDKTAKYRKPVMIAAAAVLLALVAFQGVRMFAGSGGDADVATIEMSIDESGTAVADVDAIADGAVAVREIDLDEPVAVSGNTAGDTVTVTTTGPDQTFTFGGDTATEPTTEPAPETLAERLAEDDAPRPLEPQAVEQQAIDVQEPVAQQIEVPIDTAATVEPQPAAPVVAFDVPRRAGSEALVAAASAGRAEGALRGRHALFQRSRRHPRHGPGRNVVQGCRRSWLRARAIFLRLAAGEGHRRGTRRARRRRLVREGRRAGQRPRHAQPRRHQRHGQPAGSAARHGPCRRMVQTGRRLRHQGQPVQSRHSQRSGHGRSAEILEEAYKWFAIAAKTGDTDAAAKRDEVAEAMGQGDLDRARSVANSWTARPLDEAANRVTIPESWKGRPVPPSQPLPSRSNRPRHYSTSAVSTSVPRTVSSVRKPRAPSWISRRPRAFQSPGRWTTRFSTRSRSRPVERGRSAWAGPRRSFDMGHNRAHDAGHRNAVFAVRPVPGSPIIPVARR